MVKAMNRVAVEKIVRRAWPSLNWFLRETGDAPTGDGKTERSRVSKSGLGLRSRLRHTAGRYPSAQRTFRAGRGWYHMV